LAAGELIFYEADLLDEAALLGIFEEHSPDAVVHFAGLKAVGESVADPMRYYRINVGGSLNLIDAMRRTGVHQLVFSSSATVYGDPDRMPLTEDSRLGAT